MGSLCLSAAPILRCEGFSVIQNSVLIIPPALELVFVSTLLFTNWKSNSSRSFLLVVAEGWLSFALALLELLSHIIPSVRDSLGIFKILDIVIGALSSLPIFLYIVFLFLFSRVELVTVLPNRFQTVAKVLLALFIPAIIASNELASFIGISHRTILVNGTTVIAIGFSRTADQALWTFFTSLTLALLTAYQAMHFCLAFFRLAKVFIAQRQLETTSSDSAYLFKGTGWITGAFKLGAIETVIGFASQSGFGGVVTRRSVRFLSRAFLCIGIIRGVDIFVDFSMESDEMPRKGFRRSQLRNMIGNPRFSTFAQLSPSATTFHAVPGVNEKNTRAMSGLPGMAQFASMRHQPPRRRVTIHIQGGAPTLEMRFSALDLPSPTVITERVKSQPPSQWTSISRPASSYYPNSIMSRRTEAPLQTPIHDRHTRAISDFSLYPDSLTGVRELASQFPGIPPRVTDASQVQLQGEMPWEDPYPSNRAATVSRGNSNASRASANLSSSNSLSRRKPVPTFAGTIDPFDDNDDPLDEIVIGVDRNRIHDSMPVSVGDGSYLHDSVDNSRYKFGSIPSAGYSDTMTPTTAFTGLAVGTPQSSTTTPGTDNPFQYDGSPAGQVKVLHVVDGSSGEATPVQEYRGESRHRPIPSADLNATVARIRETIPLSRIKTLGNVPRRVTPTPTKTGYRGGSMYLEPITIPLKQPGMPIIIQEDSSVGSEYSSALRDSEILGRDDDIFVRR